MGELPADRDILSGTVRMAWPSIMESFLVSLVGMVDTFMVSSLGVYAIAAVGLTTQPKFIGLAVFISLNVAVSAIVARRKGEGNRESANKVLQQALLITGGLLVVVSTLCVAFADPILHLAGSQPDTHRPAVTYFRIVMGGMAFNVVSMVINAAQRGAGNTRISLTTNLVSNLVNVVFDYLLIGGHFGFPALGVAGASIATVIGQFVAFAIAISVILKGNGFLKLEFRKGFKPDRGVLGDILNIGLPAMVEQLLMRAGIIIYAKTVASLGTVAYATHQVCMNIQALSFMTGQAFAVSATTLMGQSLGKRRYDMAQAYTSRTRTVGFLFSLILAAIFVLFGGNIVGLYNSNPEIIRIGGHIMLIVAFLQPFQSSQFIVAGGLRGAGDTRTTAMITFVTVLLVRPVFAIILIRMGLGLYGAWYALAADQLLRSALVLARYQSGKWKTIRLRNEV